MGPSTAKRMKQELAERRLAGRPRTVVLGKPPTYRADVAEIVLSAVANGESLRSVVARHDGQGWPAKTTIRNWGQQDPDGFGARYEEAVKFGTYQMAEDIVDIADDKVRLDPNEPGDVARDNARINSRKWFVGAFNPSVFGERAQLQHSGSVDGKVQIDVRLVRERVMTMIEGIRTRLTSDK